MATRLSTLCGTLFSSFTFTLKTAWINAQNLNFFGGESGYIMYHPVETEAFQIRRLDFSDRFATRKLSHLTANSARMYASRGINTIPRHLIGVGIILACFTGILLAQTFQYSRGWTNGRKRSPLIFTADDRNENPENFGICQMQILKHILEHKHHGEAYLPCETFDRAEDDINRLRGGFETSSIADTLPALKNQGIRKIDGI